MTAMMKAMVLNAIGELGRQGDALQFVEMPIPQPTESEIRIRVAMCGVCHTDLDEIEGRALPPRLPVVLGHQVVGRVDALGPGVSRYSVGDRVGVGWIFCSSGQPDENLCPDFRATGRDANGGYSQYMIVGERYAYPMPESFADRQAAPLLCAGAIGYRALRLTNLQDGEPLGLTGFGSSAHLVLQLARHLLPSTEVYVFARDERTRGFARMQGADWVGDTMDLAPRKLAAMIDTTPAWKPIVAALDNLAPGGRLVINAIRKQDDDKSYLQNLCYHEHLWMEKEIKSVANITHHDIAEFLPIAAEIPIRPETTIYPLSDANRALRDLKFNSVRGSLVLDCSLE